VPRSRHHRPSSRRRGSRRPSMQPADTQSRGSRRGWEALGDPPGRKDPPPITDPMTRSVASKAFRRRRGRAPRGDGALAGTVLIRGSSRSRTTDPLVTLLGIIACAHGARATFSTPGVSLLRTASRRSQRSTGEAPRAPPTAPARRAGDQDASSESGIVGTHTSKRRSERSPLGKHRPAFRSPIGSRSRTAAATFNVTFSAKTRIARFPRRGRGRSISSSNSGKSSRCEPTSVGTATRPNFNRRARSAFRRT